MSEHFPIDPGQTDPTSISEEILLQQSGIREMVDARVQDTPATGWKAESTLKCYGIEGGEYDVYTDTVPEFGGGFKRIVSKENPSETLEGLSWPHIGGSMSNLNRYIYNYALRPNGDLVGRVSVENNEGQKIEEVSLSADSPDPKAAERYRRQLALMHEMAQEMMVPADERHPSMPAVTPERQRQATQGRLSKFLGRFSLR